MNTNLQKTDNFTLDILINVELSNLLNSLIVNNNDFLDIFFKNTEKNSTLIEKSQEVQDQLNNQNWNLTRWGKVSE